MQGYSHAWMARVGPGRPKYQLPKTSRGAEPLMFHAAHLAERKPGEDRVRVADSTVGSTAARLG